MISKSFKGFLLLILAVSFFNIGAMSRKKAVKPFEEADHFYNLKRYEEAKKKYQKVIEVYGNLDNLSQANRDYNKQFILTYAFYQIGESEFNQDKYSEAIANYNKCLGNDSFRKWEEKCFSKIGLAYFYQAKYPEAIYYLKNAASPESQYYLAFSYELMGEPEEARLTFEKFLEMYPGHAWAGKVQEKLD